MLSGRPAPAVLRQMNACEARDRQHTTRKTLRTIAYAIMEDGTGHEVGMGRVTTSESWILLCGCYPLTS